MSGGAFRGLLEVSLRQRQRLSSSVSSGPAVLVRCSTRSGVVRSRTSWVSRVDHSCDGQSSIDARVWVIAATFQGDLAGVEASNSRARAGSLRR